MSVYKELQDEMILELNDKEVSSANAAVLTGKLLQVANGAIYTDSGEIVKVHDRKLDALEDIIDIENKTSEIKLNIKTLSQFSNQNNYTSLYKYINTTKENIDNIMKKYTFESNFDKIESFYSQNSNSVDLFCNFLEVFNSNFQFIYDQINNSTMNINQSTQPLFDNLKIEPESIPPKEEEIITKPNKPNEKKFKYELKLYFKIEKDKILSDIMCLTDESSNL